MGLFRKLGFAADVAKKTAFTQPAIWSPQHILNSPLLFDAGLTSDRERIETNFEGYVQAALKTDGPVFACILARQMVFSEARFQWRRFEQGRPTDLFGTPELSILENPWPGGTTGELLAHMEQDASLAGNSWWTIADDEGRFGRAAAKGSNPRLVRLRPDWVTMVIGSKSGHPWALDGRVVGIKYEPPRNALDGASPSAETILLMPDEVAHYSPVPDPVARYRGMSWVTPVVREIEADIAATTHKRQFFENGATPLMAIKFDKDTDEDAFEEFVTGFRQHHQGSWNAYKTLFLMGGADVTPLTHDFRQMDFSSTIGKGESRIAAAAGVPSSWVGFSEGMQGSSLNAGNFAAARRRFADGTIRPLWRIAAASLEPLVRLIDDAKDGRSLWYDERDIAFLREDETDRAEINRINLNAIDAGIKAGFEPDACVEAVRDNDITKLLGKHTGLVSVQMQPPVKADDENEQNAEEANIRSTQASVVSALVTQGFTPESIAQFMQTGDPAVLEKDPMKVQQEQAALDGARASADQAHAAARGQEQAANQPPKKPKPDDGAAKPPKGDAGKGNSNGQ